MQGKLENKYLLEDEVWDKWGVELGDVHLSAKINKENKKVLSLYTTVKSLCP